MERPVNPPGAVFFFMSVAFFCMAAPTPRDYLYLFISYNLMEKKGVQGIFLVKLHKCQPQHDPEGNTACSANSTQQAEDDFSAEQFMQSSMDHPSADNPISQVSSTRARLASSSV